MSKELTEQWRNGKLGGRWYYIKVLGKIEIARLSKYNQFYHLPITNGYAANKDASEVLAPVPTYEEWKAAYECQLMESEEVLTLKQQLKEAKEILYDVWDCRGSREYYAEKAKEYFEKWGVE